MHKCIHEDGFGHFTHDLLSILSGTPWPLFHVPLNVLPMIFLMTPLIVHYLDTLMF